MTIYVSIPLVLATALLFASGSDDDSIKSLIHKLGSASSKERQAATHALEARPEAAPAVRDALRSLDPEVARRSAAILEYYDGRPLRDLNAAVKDGNMDRVRVIKLLADWPKEKYEDQAWNAVRDVRRTLTTLHHKQGGADIAPAWSADTDSPVVISARRVTGAGSSSSERLYFIRAAQVDLGPFQGGPQTRRVFLAGAVIVAAGSVRGAGDISGAQLVLAGGNVELSLRGYRNVIVSCGDVTLKADYKECLVIARGSVTCDKGLLLLHTRIISGKSVVYDKKKARGCTITENEPNPLGYIRWADAPKEKPVPKSK